MYDEETGSRSQAMIGSARFSRSYGLTQGSTFPQPTDGAGLYADYCANCHGADGRGGVSQLDLNAEVHETAEFAENGANVTDYTNRTGYMPALDLTPQEIDAIIEYMQNGLGLAY